MRAALVCPRCRGELDEHEDGLRCAGCRLLFPVVEGIPWMLEDRARAC